MMKYLLILSFVFFSTQHLYAQEKPLITVEDGYLIIKIKLDQVDMKGLNNVNLRQMVKEAKSNISYHGNELYEHQNNISELLAVIEIYENLLLSDNKNLPQGLSLVKRTLTSMKLAVSYNLRNSDYTRSIGATNINYSFNKISSVGNVDITYSFDKIWRVGDINILYAFDKVSRIGDIDIIYAFGKLSRIGDYNID